MVTTLFRSSSIVFSRFEPKVFFTISSAFWSGVWSAGSAHLASFPLGVSPIRSSASRAATGMAAARAIPTGLKTWISSPPTLCTDMETTATNKCAEVVKVKMRVLFGTTYLLLSQDETGNLKMCQSPRKPKKNSSETHMQVRGDATRKEHTREDKMRNLPNCKKKKQTNSCTKKHTSSQFDLRRFWMARAAFDLTRTTRGFSPILQATLTFGKLWCLIPSDQVWLHPSITPCTFARDRRK